MRRGTGTCAGTRSPISISPNPQSAADTHAPLVPSACTGRNAAGPSTRARAPSTASSSAAALFTCSTTSFASTLWTVVLQMRTVPSSSATRPISIPGRSAAVPGGASSSTRARPRGAGRSVPGSKLLSGSLMATRKSALVISTMARRGVHAAPRGQVPISLHCSAFGGGLHMTLGGRGVRHRISSLQARWRQDPARGRRGRRAPPRRPRPSVSMRSRAPRGGWDGVSGRPHARRWCRARCAPD